MSTRLLFTRELLRKKKIQLNKLRITTARARTFSFFLPEANWQSADECWAAARYTVPLYKAHPYKLKKSRVHIRKVLDVYII